MDKSNQVQERIRNLAILRARANELDELLDELRKEYLEELRRENLGLPERPR